jgi:hypothetical protein
MNFSRELADTVILEVEDPKMFSSFLVPSNWRFFLDKDFIYLQKPAHLRLHHLLSAAIDKLWLDDPHLAGC